MDRTNIDKKQTQKLIKEVFKEIGDIRNQSEAYCAMITREYEESNLHFLKVLSDMFSTDEKNNGTGAQAVRLAALCKQANEALEEFFKEE